MKLSEELSQATCQLRRSGIQDPANECIVLLGHTLELDRAQIYACSDRELTTTEAEKWRQLILRRLTGEPAAYIVQSKEFYGIELYVDRRVLVPRPETEILVEAVIHFTQAHPRPAAKPWLIADVGTGSGAIAIALAGGITDCRICATDISPPALEIAAINVKRHGLSGKISLLEGNLLEPLDCRFDIIAANLPYIADADYASLQREVVDHEPGQALRGGVNGTELIRQLVAQAGRKLFPGGAIFIEVGQGQSEEVSRMLHLAFAGAKVSLLQDFAGIDRVVSIVN